jgi:hypothetical protein
MAQAQGNVEKVAKHLDMPESTLRSWVNVAENKDRKPKGAGQDAEIYDKNRAELSQLLDIAIRDAMEELPGKWSEATAREIAVAVGIFTDKLQLLTGGATSRNEINLREMSDDELRAIADA